MEAYKLNFEDEYIEQVFKSNLNKIILEGRKAIKPPPDITVSEWADRNRMLPETSAEPGRWRTARLPHSKGIMDSVCMPATRQISVMKSSQIGGTEILNNIIGYFIDIDPCSIILMQPTDNDARDYAQQKLDPMINDTKALRDKVSKKKSGNSDNSILRKKYPGGRLTIVSGKSTSSTRQRSARVTIGDDIDGIEIGHTREGDPVTRLIKRSTTYADSLNINISTPTLDGQSRISALYEMSNKQKFNVPCPHCGVKQVLKPENLTWEKDKDAFGKVIAHYPETVRYACEGCGTLLTEGERMEMLRQGEWIAEKPEIINHQGFWINELSSSISSMVKVAQAIIDAGDDPDKLEALHNTVFGIPWKKVQGKETDPVELMDAVEDFISVENMLIPNDVLVLTAAVDVQAGSGEKEARLEVKVVGWGMGKERWIIYLGKIPGNIKQKEIWNKLDEFWERKWFRKDGIELKIKRKFIDSGYESQTVYEYTRNRQNEGIIAVKGANKYGAPLLPRRASLVDKGRTLLIAIGTQAAKYEIFSCLNRIKTKGPKYTHFAKAFCNSEYFKQLTSEHAVRKTTGLIDYIMYEKKKKSDSNEALDLYVYNYAAMEHLNPNFEAIKKNYDKILSEKKEEAEEERPEPVKQVRKINKVRHNPLVNNWW